MTLTLLLALLVASTLADPVPKTVGFEIGDVTGYRMLAQSGSSKIYEIECPQIKDGRPMKLVELVGSHYDVGFDYAALLGTPSLTQASRSWKPTKSS